jgi:hypothetical protein
VLKLPRLSSRTPVTDKLASTPFQRFWDQFARAIEAAFNGQAGLEQKVTGVAYRDQINEFTDYNFFDVPLEVTQGLTVGGVQVVGPRDTGWTAGTGTPDKGAFAAYAGQVIGGAYSQTQVQALDNAAKADSQRILAIEQALAAHGLIGP